MTAITRQHMIEKCKLFKEGDRIYARDVELFEAILVELQKEKEAHQVVLGKEFIAELQKMEERTLPELPKGMKYQSIVFGTNEHSWSTPCNPNPRQSILNAISKIPTDQPKEN